MNTLFKNKKSKTKDFEEIFENYFNYNSKYLHIAKLFLVKAALNYSGKLGKIEAMTIYCNNRDKNYEDSSLEILKDLEYLELLKSGSNKEVYDYEILPQGRTLAMKLLKDRETRSKINLNDFSFEELSDIIAQKIE